MEPILGFRAWGVSDVKQTPRPQDPIKAAAGSHVVAPELDAWLAKKLFGDPEQAKKPTTRPAIEPGTLRSVGFTKGVNVWRAPGPSFQFGCLFGHELPDLNCSCGLYACLTVPDAVRRGGDVIGAVIAWGHLVLHGIEGFRAEHMRIVALAARDKTRARKARLASERYGIPLVDVFQLELVGREFGRPITWSYDDL